MNEFVTTQNEDSNTQLLQNLFYMLFPGVENLTNMLSKIKVTNTMYRRHNFDDAAGVVSPNRDTLYISAICDLSAGPVKIHVPETNRYLSLQFTDLWCRNFNYLLNTNPGSHTLVYCDESNGCCNTDYNQDDENVIKSPCKLCLIIGRVYANYYDRTDIEDAAIVLDGITIVGGKTINPLSNTVATITNYGTNNCNNSKVTNDVPKLNAKATPLNINWFLKAAVAVNKYQQIIYPEILTNLITNPGLNRLVYNAFSAAQYEIKEALTSQCEKRRQSEVGWRLFASNLFDTDFEFAVVQWQGLYVNDCETAAYYFNSVDQQGQQYCGSEHSYFIVFDELPPHDPGAFWSITCYNPDGNLPVTTKDLPHRCIVGTNSNVVKNKYGKYIIFLLPVDSPLNACCPINNILNIPNTPCNFILRIYSPSQNNYYPPPIQIHFE